MRSSHLLSPIRCLFGCLIGCLMAALLASGLPARAQAPVCETLEASTWSGAYRRTDGTVLSILPADAPGRWRITHFESGRSHQLHPADGGRFHSAADLNSAQPVAFHYRFTLGARGQAQSLSVEESGKGSWQASRIALRERAASFKSGEVELAGRLTLPASGNGPFKTVIFVHGSDPVPSIGQEWLPHLLAAHGVATLVFDKRGTGCSKGPYVQHFDVLSDDVVAAARWLKSQAEIDPRQIGLAGFSQGGWVAPLAALKEPSIGFVAVGYGLAMPMADEDRLEAPLKLRLAGADDTAVAEFQELNTALHQLARENFKDWSCFESLLERFQTRPWFALAAQQQSWFGVFSQMGLAQAKAVAPQMFTSFFQPFYDPVPTLEKLAVPMLWLLAEKDIEAPPEQTLEVLNRLRGQGKPISVQVFANADHGLQEFELRDGKRIRTKYADGYFASLLKWIQDRR